MARFNSLRFLLHWRMLIFWIVLGSIPVVGTVLIYCPWLREAVSLF